MTTRYVGPGGSDANSGLTWALRKLTLNGVEDTPVVAGDTVYVGPGTYRETLTVDVNGSAGNPITYAADYTGVNTDGVGGIVRITGSDDDQTATRQQCVTGTTKIYRTFQGFVMDTVIDRCIVMATGCTNWIVDKCVFQGATADHILVSGAAQLNNTIQNCIFYPADGQDTGILFTHTATVNAAGHVVQNCIFIACRVGIQDARIGGITAKNNIFLGCGRGFYIITAPAAGQTVTLNNNIFVSCPTSAIVITADSQLVEDYNQFSLNAVNITGGTPPAIGANSVTYVAHFDPRWAMELFFRGAGPSSAQLVSPFDMASYNTLINVAGTGAPSTDLRGTGTIGSQREWGPLEYDSTLQYRQGILRGLTINQAVNRSANS